MHPFERAGLGIAPFRFVGMTYEVGPIRSVDPKSGVTIEVGAPGQPMSSCDYCGTGIANVCHVKDANGKRFKVGCDCVAKVYAEGNVAADKLLTDVDAARRKVERDKAAKRREAKRLVQWEKDAAVRAEAEAILASHPEALTGRLHPYGRAGETYRNYATWCLTMGGANSWHAVRKALGEEVGQ